MNAKRKKPTFKERTTPCIACGYPISQQHHIFHVAIFGAGPETLPLCANCHEIAHMLHGFHHHKSKHATRILIHLLMQDNDLITYVIIYLAGVVLLVDRKVGEEFAEMSIEDRAHRVIELMPDLFSAFRTAKKLAEKRKKEGGS